MNSSKKQQFSYLLQLKNEALISDPDAWTEKDNNIVSIHFAYLQNLLQQGTLLMAGRSLVATPNNFGIVVFEAESEVEACQIMENDPAVKQGLMTAELHPFRVALWRS